MISANDSYWSVGISVSWHENCGADNGVWHSGWSATLDFYDNGFAGDDDADRGLVSTEGTLHTRYALRDGKIASGLSVAIDVLLADAARLGITFKHPKLMYVGDGEWEDYPPPPGWQEILTTEAERIGWKSPYTKRKA